MIDFLEQGDAVYDGMWRRVFNDCVTWQPAYIYHDKTIDEWDYVVEKYPFVPGFHVCQIDDEAGIIQDRVLSSHKTLAEAMSICKVLLANGGIRYE
jgi:hypothetical protein